MRKTVNDVYLKNIDEKEILIKDFIKREIRNGK